MSVKSAKESEQSVVSEDKRKKKDNNPLRKKKWTCEGEPLWRIYFNSYIEKEKKLEREDKLNRRKKADLPPQDLESGQDMYPYECYPLNILNRRRAQLLDPIQDSYPGNGKLRIWRNMKADPQIDMSSLMKVPPEAEVRATEGWTTGERCIPYRDGAILGFGDVDIDDYATCRELGHARVPASCLAAKKTQQIVDRSTGERPGLVDGDYVTCELESKGDYRVVYTQVCLRGTKGMHLIELTREREKTWKFCFYQALVALLARTQLRYKFATSNNIDYIYDLAWMLFLHVGSLSVNRKLRLDDVLVYNYNYCVELELVQELKGVRKIAGAGFRFLEKGAKIKAMKRPELMKMTRELGQEKKKVILSEPVHEGTRKIEQWFDELPDTCRNCVFKTGKFSVGFWKDGSFWYLYNPYRCDRFGFWDDNGKACIVKFCSRAALRRHLMILLVRAYGFEVVRADFGRGDEGFGNLESEESRYDNPVNDEINLENVKDNKEGHGENEVKNEEMNITNDGESLENDVSNAKDGEEIQEDDKVNSETAKNDLENEKNEVENPVNDEVNLDTTDNLENEEENKVESEEVNPTNNEEKLENDLENTKDDEEHLENEVKLENTKDDEEIGENDQVNVETAENDLENGNNEDENLTNTIKNSDDADIFENEDTNLDNKEENLSTERVNLEDLKNEEKVEENLNSSEIKMNNRDNTLENNKLTIQIFQLNYDCVKLHNYKLLSKNSKPKTRLVTKKVEDDDSAVSKSDNELITSNDNTEKPSWLSENRITWSKVSSRSSSCRKARWHEYLVEEPRKLFSLWGEIHPTGRMFSPENRGKQIHACYLVCLGMSRIMAPEYWSSKTLDTVVMCGDRYYTCSRLQSDGALGNFIENNNNNQRNNADVDRGRISWERNLTRHFKIGDMLFEVKVLPAICGKLYSRNSLWKILQQMFLTHSHGVFTCEGACLAIFKFCGAYYILDANSFGPPIFDYGHGTVYLLRATSFIKFIKTLVLIVNSLEPSRFSVNPVEIMKIIDLETSPLEIKREKLNKKLKKNKRQ